MGMTMTQKILAKHSGQDYVEIGQLIMADVDMVLEDLGRQIKIEAQTSRDF